MTQKKVYLIILLVFVSPCIKCYAQNETAKDSTTNFKNHLVGINFSTNDESSNNPLLSALMNEFILKFNGTVRFTTEVENKECDYLIEIRKDLTFAGEKYEYSYVILLYQNKEPKKLIYNHPFEIAIQPGDDPDYILSKDRTQIIEKFIDKF